MQGDRLQTLGLELEADKQEVDQKSAEQEEEDVEELDLRMVDDGRQHQVERSKEHNDGDDGGDLQWAEPWMVKRCLGVRDVIPCLARGATCWATEGPAGSRSFGTSPVLSVLCESSCVRASSCTYLPLFFRGVLHRRSECPASRINAL